MGIVSEPLQTATQKITDLRSMAGSHDPSELLIGTGLLTSGELIRWRRLRRGKFMAAPHNFLHRWFEEVWNKGRIEAIDEMAAPNVIAHGLVDAQGNELVGTEAFKTFWRQFRGAFPDIRVDVEDALVDGNKVMVRCMVRATHCGEGIGIAPTGKPVTFTGMCVARLKDCQMAEAWNNFDFLSLYQQLGIVPKGLA
jgi:predicted ester cyclase